MTFTTKSHLWRENENGTHDSTSRLIVSLICKKVWGFQKVVASKWLVITQKSGWKKGRFQLKRDHHSGASSSFHHMLSPSLILVSAAVRLEVKSASIPLVLTTAPSHACGRPSAFCSGPSLCHRSPRDLNTGTVRAAGLLILLVGA